MIRDLVRGGTTVLLTTQYLEEADQLAERIAVLDQGRVIANDTPTRPKAHFGRGFRIVGIVAVCAPLAVWRYRRTA
jgi:ABC-2 type transport system ATP-binding protein